jgi:ubiquinone/menaquinone biosynthesis C-methylase UbiE
MTLPTFKSRRRIDHDGPVASAGSPVVAQFDRAADTYDASRLHRWLAATVADFVSTGHRRVLDIATGTGLVARALATHAPATMIVGADISYGMLTAARRQLAVSARWLAADASHLPFTDDTFDLVTCVSAMAYLPRPEAALTEWRRVTGQGRVVFTTWSQDGLTLPLLVRRAAATIGVDIADPNAALGNPYAIRRAVTAAGFTRARIAEATYPEPLRHTDQAWHAFTDSVFGTPLRTLPATDLTRARRAFDRLVEQYQRSGRPGTSHTYLVEVT